LGVFIFKVIDPGVFATIQKLPGQAQTERSIPKSGAFDQFALKIGNLILRNPLGEAGIELTGEGGEIEVMRRTAIAVTGGNFDVRRNGKQIQQWCAVALSKGDTVSVVTSKSGWRCYICVAGGVKGLHVATSKSRKGRIGRLFGHPLKRGDVLITEPPSISLHRLTGRRAKEAVLPKLGGTRELRIVLMAQYDLLKEESKEVFLNSSYRVSSDSGRVCYRFEGPQLLFKEKVYGGGEYGAGANALNAEDSPGLIQVAADGEVVCTGPDFVAASGRIPIAHLVAPDMDRVAQLRPKDHIRFKVVTQDDARLIFDHSMGLISEANILSTQT
jgi:antagonist of KipI